MLLISTTAHLNFSPEQVWAVLSDFSRYAKWNPLNVEAAGQPVAGSRVPMSFIDPGTPGRTLRQKVKITIVDPPHKLEWLGYIPVLFSGRHFFELASDGAGTVLTHGEALSGLIPTFWGEARVEQQRRAYENMNDALRRRLEQVFP